MDMLFRKKIERACTYCSRGTHLNDELVLCTKKGIREPWSKCRRFQYDPTKRIPAKSKALDLAKSEADDFSL